MSEKEMSPEEKLLWAIFGDDVPKGFPGAEGGSDNRSLKERIEVLLETLTFREREIIMMRYGFGDGTTYTLEDVGRLFKVTRERVRQIEAKAVRKLRGTQE